MRVEPTTKRTIAFLDGQNLFHAAREAFGAIYPDYDPLALAQKVCSKQGWSLTGTRFYTGVPDSTDNAFWHHFWSAKLLAMKRRGLVVFSRRLRYRNKTVTHFLTAQSTRSWLERRRGLTYGLPWMSSGWRARGNTMSP
jgi:hypothetical protein